MTADSAPLASQDSARAQRRAVPRYPFVTFVMVTEIKSGIRLPAQTSELGLNGCYINTREPFLVDTSVWIRIFKDREVFESPGRVLHFHPGIGMGVLFVDPKPDQRPVLERWLADLAARTSPNP
jgi:hypothetical protein